jgi:hypothetical protein
MLSEQIIRHFRDVRGCSIDNGMMMDGWLQWHAWCDASSPRRVRIDRSFFLKYESMMMNYICAQAR